MARLALSYLAVLVLAVCSNALPVENANGPSSNGPEVSASAATGGMIGTPSAYNALKSVSEMFNPNNIVPGPSSSVTGSLASAASAAIPGASNSPASGLLGGIPVVGSLLGGGGVGGLPL